MFGLLHAVVVALSLHRGILPLREPLLLILWAILTALAGKRVAPEAGVSGAENAPVRICRA